jgi:transposase InsO family protein
VVGWSIDSAQTASLVVNALGMAIENRQAEGTVIHSDHGTQGGFQWSSQHLGTKVIDDDEQASAPARDSGDAREDLVAGAAVDGTA